MVQNYIYFLDTQLEIQCGRCTFPKALLNKIRETNPGAYFVYVFPYSHSMAVKIAAFLHKLTQADRRLWVKAGPYTAHKYCDLVLKLPPLTACMNEYEELRKELNS